MAGAVITLSDKGTKGEREDKSGPAISARLRENRYEVIEQLLLSDDPERLREELIRICDQRRPDLILTTGGTGFFPRDTAPEAMLSRAVSVIRGKMLIINFSGGLKACMESMDVFLDTILHGIRCNQHDRGIYSWKYGDHLHHCLSALAHQRRRRGIPLGSGEYGDFHRGAAGGQYAGKAAETEDEEVSLDVNIEKDLGAFHLSAKFSAEQGITGLLGASGSGKSMTFKCIAGIEAPDRGRIVLDGVRLFDSEQKINLPPQKRQIGYLFQNYALFPNMTVRKTFSAGCMR